MTNEQSIAFEALLAYETVGDLPDLEVFQLCFDELNGLKKLAARYQRLVDECHHNENLRHSPQSNSRPSNVVNAADVNDGSSPLFGEWNN